MLLHFLHCLSVRFIKHNLCPSSQCTGFSRCLSVVIAQKQSLHYRHSVTSHSESCMQTQAVLSHRMHPLASQSQARTNLNSCQNSHMSQYMLMFLHFRQKLCPHEAQPFGQYLSLSHMLQLVFASPLQVRPFPHSHRSWSFTSRVRCWLSLSSGSRSMQFSQIPKLQALSSQMPVLKMEAFIPQTSQMYWRVQSLKRVKLWPMGHRFLEQGGILHSMQYFSSHFLQMERHSFCSEHSAQIEETISLYLPMKNYRLCCLGHLQSCLSLRFARSSPGVKAQFRWCWWKSLTERMGCWHCWLKGQLNSNLSGGTLQAKKGLLQRLGQRSLMFLVCDTHQMQKTRWQGPLHFTSSVLRSKQMPHSNSSKDALFFMQFLGLKVDFCISSFTKLKQRNRICQMFSKLISAPLNRIQNQTEDAVQGLGSSVREKLRLHGENEKTIYLYYFRKAIPYIIAIMLADASEYLDNQRRLKSR